MNLHNLNLFYLIRVNLRNLRNPSSPTGLRRTGLRLEIRQSVKSVNSAGCRMACAQYRTKIDSIIQPYLKKQSQF